MPLIKNLILLISNQKFIPYILKLTLVVFLELIFNFVCFWRTKTVQPVKVKNKTCLITGGTKSIGNGLVKILSRSGYEVIVLGRSEVEQSENVKFIKFDLSNLDEVKQFKLDGELKDKRIDLLIFNAGVMVKTFDTTYSKRTENQLQNRSILTSNNSQISNLNSFALDNNFKINYLSHFILYENLKDNLSENTRVVVTSSCMGLTTDNFDPLKESFLPGNRKYAESKFCSFLLARYISRSYQTVVLHPGIIPTGLFDSDNLSYFLIHRLFFSFTNTLEEGTNVLLNACNIEMKNHHRLTFLYGFDRIKLPKSVNERNLRKLLDFTNLILNK